MNANYRVDAFSNTSQAVNKSNEIYAVPANSPFVITLDEIPKKETPSTLTMRVVDFLAAAITTAGATTLTATHGAWFATDKIITIDSEKMLISDVSSNTLTVSRGYAGTTATTHTINSRIYIESSMTEVASTPTAGQFWPDYSTSADGDANWNNGDIQFNSSDAGKYVAISYSGTGSRDGRESIHLDYSPFLTAFGAEADSSFVSTGTHSLGGEYHYKDFSLLSGHQINASGALIIRCTGLAYIAGVIYAAGQGASGGSAVQGGSGTFVSGGSGVSGNMGGGGGNGGYPTGGSPSSGGYSCLKYPSMLAASPSATPAAKLQQIAWGGSLEFPFFGAGGAGGQVYSSYSTTYSGAGGAGGGCVIIVAKRIIFTGTISVNGAVGGGATQGGGGVAGGGGGGGGGVTIMAAQKWLSDTGTITVAGGSAGASVGTCTPGNAGGAGWYKKINL